MKPHQTVVLVAVVCLALTQALPVKEKKPTPEEEKKAAEAAHEDADDWELNLEYGRYLKEVVQALESDQVFRKKLETAEVDDIKSGKIARELHFVDHNVRTKLDELKRRELERLRQAAVREHEKQTGVDRTLLKIPVHIDHRNPTRFEVDDLKQLITTTTKDLEKVDQERKKDFKKYEIEKEFDRQQELQEMDDSHRKEAEDKHQQGVKHHKQHDKLHHPGSKQQLEEVWEEQDHMQPEDFDPNTFFHLHDLDGNGYWDQTEVKALFKKELDKMYDPNAPEDDMMERYEEMERMREHVFRESDADKDNLISFREFVDQTKRADFEQDNGWQGLDEQQEFYSQQEYEEYERQRQEEIHRLVESGADPAQLAQQGHLPAGHPAQGQVHPAQGQVHPAQGQVHPAQLQAAQGQVHPAQLQAAQGQLQGGQLQAAQGQVHPAQLYPAQVQQAQPAQVQPPQTANAQQGYPTQNQPAQMQGVQGQQHPEAKAAVAGQVHQPPQPIAGNVEKAHLPQPVVGQADAAHH